VTARQLLVELHRAALLAVDGERVVERALASEPIEGAVALLACGKASAPMTRGALRALGPRVRRGRVTVLHGSTAGLAPCSVGRAAHPLPDEGSLLTAHVALELAAGLSPEETLLVLLSGGASSMWAAPAEGLSLEHKRATTDLLLRSGADILGINAVRKHLSAIKGGRLAQAAHGASIVTFALSDVRGDPAEAIGSGPTVADPTTYADALAVVDAADLRSSLPRAVRLHLEAGARGEREETPKPSELGAAPYRIVGSLRGALDAAAREARARGLRVREEGAVLYGEARALAQPLIEAGRRALAEGARILLAGGEPTVRVRGGGRGGRQQELALALALSLEREGLADWTALCAATDGVDGPTDAAGAFADASLPARARSRALDPEGCLERHDSHALLAECGDLYRTGPTATNVNDVVMLALDPEVGAIG
jgi:hydroxypyruvate reductase